LDPSAADIDRMHRARGWNGIGYHFVIRRDGRVEAGRSIDKSGAHVEGFNRTTIGVCFSGHGDHADFTAEQKRAGYKLVANLVRENGLEEEYRANPMRVLGHAEVGKFRRALAIMTGVLDIPDPRKSCPGRKVDMRAFRIGVLVCLGAED